MIPAAIRNRAQAVWAQQKEFTWRDVADYYAPLQREKDANRVSKGESKFASTPTLAGFRCNLTNGEEVSLAGPIGRGNLSNMDTADFLRVDIDVDMADGGYFQLKTPGHPLYGQWFIVQGDAQVLALMANTKIHLIKQSPKAPPGYLL